MPPSNVSEPESMHHTAAVAAEAASPLDDFLSGEHHHKYPFGFTISITKNEHKLSLPAAMPSEYEQKNGEEEEEWSCDESASLVSELTQMVSELTQIQMTYRSELMKQDSVIQLKLKLQLAQKQATLDELTSKYNALLVQMSARPHNVVAENSRLMRENEWLQAQLRQAGIASPRQQDTS